MKKFILSLVLVAINALAAVQEIDNGTGFNFLSTSDIANGWTPANNVNDPWRNAPMHGHYIGYNNPASASYDPSDVWLINGFEGPWFNPGLEPVFEFWYRYGDPSGRFRFPFSFDIGLNSGRIETMFSASLLAIKNETVDAIPFRFYTGSNTWGNHFGIYAGPDDYMGLFCLTNGVAVIDATSAAGAFKPRIVQRINGSEVFRTDFCGIGVIDPATGNDQLSFNRITSDFLLNGRSGPRAGFRLDSDNGNLTLWNSSVNEKVKLQAKGKSFLNGGNVGIGTNAPAATLHLQACGSNQVFAISGVTNAAPVDGSTVAAWIPITLNGTNGFIPFYR